MLLDIQLALHHPFRFLPLTRVVLTISVPFREHFSITQCLNSVGTSRCVTFRPSEHSCVPPDSASSQKIKQNPMTSAPFERQSAMTRIRGIVTVGAGLQVAGPRDVCWSSFCNPSKETLFSWLQHQPAEGGRQQTHRHLLFYSRSLCRTGNCCCFQQLLTGSSLATCGWWDPSRNNS